MKIISGKEMVGILEKKGWILVRVSGSHHRMRPPEHLKHLQTVSVPVHKNRDMGRRMQHEIMKIAGLTEGDL